MYDICSVHQMISSIDVYRSLFYVVSWWKQFTYFFVHYNNTKIRAWIQREKVSFDWIQYRGDWKQWHFRIRSKIKRKISKKLKKKEEKKHTHKVIDQRKQVEQNYHVQPIYIPRNEKKNTRKFKSNQIISRETTFTSLIKTNHQQ